MENKQIYHKFNDAYTNDQEEMEAIQRELYDPNSNLTHEQKEFLAVKRRNYQESIELTPLPIAHRKIMQNADLKKIESYNKAQRSAVVMRRFVYEMR
jgi:hypothetical protein